jgi:hypothetical protein
MLCGGETANVRISNCTYGKPAAIIAKGYYSSQITSSTSLVSDGKTAQCPYTTSDVLISYTSSSSSSCQPYTLYEGCFDYGSCAATFAITNVYPVPTASPTTAPTRSPTAPTPSPTASPSLEPTSSSPTAAPTMYPTVSSIDCSTYSTTGTTTSSSPTCTFYACAGDTIWLTVNCGSSSSSPFALIKSPAGSTFSSGSTTCPGTSSSTVIVGPTVTTEACGTYTIRQACWGSDSCSISDVYWTVHGAQYTPSPTAAPV